MFSTCAALQILIQPQSVALLSGHNLRLSCHALGKSPVQYQWFKSKDEVSRTNTKQYLIMNPKVTVILQLLTLCSAY